MAWTPEQQAAIDSRGQTLLLSAAAGSGKTAVLVERIIRRLLDKDDPVDITELLVVTFTKAAAAEMRERVGAALAQVLADTGDAAVERQLALLPSAHISTLHSFCQDVIRKYFYTIDIDPRVTIAGEEELRLLRKGVLEAVFLSYYEDEEKAPFLYPLADMFGNDRGDDALMDTVSRMYDYSRSMPWPRKWLDDAAEAYDVPDGASIDEMAWCEPVKKLVRSSVEEQIGRYEGLLGEMKARPAFAGPYADFAAEADSLRRVLERTAWDDMRKAVMAVEFPRLKGLRKLSDEDKAFWEQCKAVRSDVKKEIAEGLQTPYFSVASDVWLDGVRAMAPVMKGLVRLTADFAEAYGAAKKEKGWIDFSDLEHFCLQILLSPQSEPDHSVPSAAAEELRQTYKEVLIDEYQDTNGVQELITTLISRGDNRFMVGDIKQSIYRFRLADPTLFLEKYRSFSRDADAVQRCIDLGRNFRSAPNILDAVNEVFARTMTEEAAGMGYGERERLYAGRTAPEDERWVGGSVEVHIVDTARDDATADEETPERDMTAFEQECQVIAESICRLKEQGKMAARKDGTLELLAYRHIVVLLRSMAGKADVLLRVLQAHGIPAYAEQNGGYFAAIEVQTVLSLLRCIDNPEQDLPMAAVLRSPIAAMDEPSLAELRLAGEQSLWRNLPAYAASLEEGEEKERLLGFCAKLQAWRTYSRRHGVAETLQELYRDTGYYDYVGGMPGGAVRQANLQALYDRARQYEASGFRGIFRYLRLIDKMKEDGLDLAPAKVLSEREDVVRVMSIHKSKGLEFPVVIAADMGKAFNRQDMHSLILFHNTLGIGLKQYDAQWRMAYPTLLWNGICAQIGWESTAEEERVLYVAMTRARDKLILTGHTSHLERDWQRWRGQVNPARARSYFDWVLPGVASRPESEAWLLGGVPSWQSGLWQVTIHSRIGAAAADAGEPAEEPRLARLKEGLPTGTAAPLWMEQALTWTYGYPAATETAAKFSVSEIKRQYNLRYAEAMEEEQPPASPLAGIAEDEDAFGPTPPWLAEQDGSAGGAWRGTVMHKVMQYIQLTPDMTDGDIRRQMASWQADGLFSEEELRLVFVPSVQRFCSSPLGRRMALSTDVRREYPFSMLLPGGGYLPALEEGERILVQGVVDCLFWQDGQWVLVDYKTDRLPDEEAFRRRYAVQLALYRQAALQVLGAPVGSAYIYSFYLDREIAFSF